MQNVQCQIIVNISLALMKQFNLFPVTRGIVVIIHGQHIIYTHRQRSNAYTLKKTKYNDQGELILNSRETVPCSFKNDTFKLQKPKIINIVKGIRLNRFT